MDATRREQLLEKVALFPTGPGVYTFLDDRSRVVYVGKAKNLRSRVRSYLREAADDGRLFYRFLVRSLHDVQFFSTASEKEALLLENTLIKRHRPRWNVKLTDDKSFLQIEVTTHGPWPRARLVRATTRGKKGEVFGPYASARSVRETLRLVKRWFPLRTCSDAELRQRTRPCIEYEMGRCLAPCVDRCTPEEYGQAVEEAVLFLSGKDDTLLPRLRDRMAEHSQALRYEQAARVRDQLRAIERTLEGQRVAVEGGGDQDVLGVAGHEGGVVVLLLQVREGQVTEPRTFELRTELPPAEALNAFLGQYYSEGRYVPREVLLPLEVEDGPLLAEVLSDRRGAQVAVKAHVRGDRRALLELAGKNAALALATGEERRRVTREVLAGLQETLGLAAPPARIECFDVSTIQGSFTVASQVRFSDGEPDPTGYRTYKVRTVIGQDDFAAMEEVLGRRLRRGVAEDDLPDLIVVDGGPSQLARALAAARAAGVPAERTALVGLAKARRPAPGRPAEHDPRTFERVHRPGGGAPILLSPASLECRFLARVRDAAHRAAVGYHRELRRKSALRSGLEEVPGVGPKRRLELLRRFGSLKRIRAASVDQLAEVVPRPVAEAIAEFVGRADEPAAPAGALDAAPPPNSSPEISP